MMDALEPILAETLAAVLIALLSYGALLLRQAVNTFTARVGLEVDVSRITLDEKHRAAIKEAAATFAANIVDGEDPKITLVQGRDYIKRTVKDAIAWHQPKDDVLDQIITKAMKG